ncbi:hypothetical protein RIF29_04816 [Crotalaria pallida]|uniref:Uncharacterized protein n=1 Tax=Crotalaria pallida TaxID=3830 RepID=A0AAN9J2F8_CROPI
MFELDQALAGAVNTFVQVNDLHNSPGPAKHELRQTTNQALQLLQDNYPEFIAKQVGSVRAVFEDYSQFADLTRL